MPVELDTDVWTGSDFGYGYVVLVVLYHRFGFVH